MAAGGGEISGFWLYAHPSRKYDIDDLREAMTKITELKRDKGQMKAGAEAWSHPFVIVLATRRYELNYRVVGGK